MSEQLLDVYHAGYPTDEEIAAKVARVVEELKNRPRQPWDMVNSPPHYNQGKYETIDIIEDADLGYHLSAALKYILRCKYKGKTDEDLAKAVWYIERYRKLIHGTDTVPDISTEQGPEA